LAQGIKLKILSIILTFFFALFAAISIAAVLMATLPYYSLFIAPACVFVAMALNNLGGSITRTIAFMVSAILIGFGLLFIALIVSTFFNHEYDNITPAVLASFGLVGIFTFLCLNKPAV
jgi:hypothetical protein